MSRKRTTSPWEQQPGESADAYRAFSAYRDYGFERSLAKAWRKSRNVRDDSAAPVPGTWTNWSSRWKWVERARAWDAHVDRIEQEVREQRIRKLAGIRADYEWRWQPWAEKLVERLDALIQKAEQAPITDVTRKEEIEEHRDENDKFIPGKTVITRVKGVNLGAVARLAKEAAAIAREAINGPRPDKDERPVPQQRRLNLKQLSKEEVRAYLELTEKAKLIE